MAEIKLEGVTEIRKAQEREQQSQRGNETSYSVTDETFLNYKVVMKSNNYFFVTVKKCFTETKMAFFKFYSVLLHSSKRTRRD
jgi:hypothetical protein